jgi:hypothetical protein
MVSCTLGSETICELVRLSLSVRRLWRPPEYYLHRSMLLHSPKYYVRPSIAFAGVQEITCVDPILEAELS